jgi:hypothetical protein
MMKTDSLARISPRGRSQKADKLGIRLEPFRAPSRRHPEGAARCQAVTRRDGQPRQCRRNAREGFTVCSHHGAGSRKRELAGIRKNPALVRLVTGKRAKPSTVEQLLRERPDLRSFCENNFDDKDLLDMRSVLARMKAIIESLVTHAYTGRGAEKEAGALIAMHALSPLMRALYHMLRIEEQLGRITHKDMARAMTCVLSTIREFVPADRRKDSLDFLDQEMGGGQPEPEYTENELTTWTDEMLHAFEADVPLNLVRLMADPQRTQRTMALAGIATDPNLVVVAIGARPRPSTREEQRQDEPAVESVYARNHRLLDLRPILAQVKALAERLANRIDMHSGTEGRVNALRVVEALSTVIWAASNMLRLEERLGPVLHADMRRLMNGISIAIDRFVPEDHRAAARTFLEGALIRSQ